MFPGRFPNVPESMWNFEWNPQTMGLQGQFCGGDLMNQQSQAQSQAQTQVQIAALREQNAILNQQLSSQAQSHIQHLQQLIPVHQPPQPVQAPSIPPTSQPSGPQAPGPPTPVTTPATQSGPTPSFSPDEMLQQMKHTVESSLQALVEKTQERQANQPPTPPLRHLWPVPTILVGTLQTGHVPHRQVLYQSIPTNLWRRHLPLRRQTIFLLTYLLPMPLLPIHRTNLPRSFNLRTATRGSNFHRLITSWDPTTTTWKDLSLGSWKRSTTTFGLHLGKTKERLSQWQTHHLLCGLTVSPHAQHLGSTNLPADPSSMPKSLCVRRCLHTPAHSQISACRRRSHPGQPRPCWILHQHRSR